VSEKRNLMFSRLHRTFAGLVLACCMFVSGCSNSGSPSSAGTPQVSLSPTSLSFGSQTMGTTSAGQALTLSNTGTAALTVTAITASGNFAQTNNCGSTVVAGGSCTIAVTFTPTAAGARSGSLSVADNASGSPHTASLSGTGEAVQNAGCTETGTSTFPGCFSLSSPTALVATASRSAAREPARVTQLSAGNASGGFETEFAAQTAQLAALLDGTDPNPGQTLATLAASVIDTRVGNITPSHDFCFGPAMYYANDPDGISPATGMWPPGDFGIWLPTDTQNQACSASELNYLLTTDSGQTQLVLALAAEVQHVAGSNFPTSAGQSYDATSAIAQLFANVGASAISVTSVTVTFDGANYLYSAQFSAPNNMSVTTNCVLSLKHTPGADQYSYSGVAQYAFDDGTNLLAGTTRYQRTSQTHLDISARNSFYPTGSTSRLDSNGELDPSDPNWDMRFARVGASFDPTSALIPGSFLYVLQINAQGASGPGFAQSLTNVFQLVLPGDGTGSAYYGFGTANIAGQGGYTVGEIDHMYCLRASGVSQTYAQFQPIAYNSTDGQYEPSTTVTSQIRYAPTSTCTWTDAQWNNGDPSGFWYDRSLQYSNSQSQPPIPNPIPQTVVADPNDSVYPFNLFGDGAAVPQTLINQQGYTFPALY
jgi:hypothetical protein